MLPHLPPQAACPPGDFNDGDSPSCRIRKDGGLKGCPSLLVELTARCNDSRDGPGLPPQRIGLRDFHRLAKWKGRTRVLCHLQPFHVIPADVEGPKAAPQTDPRSSTSNVTSRSPSTLAGTANAASPMASNRKEITSAAKKITPVTASSHETARRATTN